MQALKKYYIGLSILGVGTLVLLGVVIVKSADHKTDKETVVRDRLNLLNLPIVATSADLTHGLKTCTESTPSSKKAALKEAKTGQAQL